VLINNLEFDHADIFQSLEEIQTSFRRLVQLVPENGALFVNADEPNALAVTTAARSPVYTVGFSETATHRILNPRYGSGARFSFMNLELELQIPGEFNVRNAAMAAAAAHFHGVAPEIIKKLSGVLATVLQEPALKTKLAPQGTVLLGGTPAQFTQYMKEEQVRWKKIITESGAKVE
jgi:UDP-N-acetylmuramate: L-alanyl-gamma-D-glutamyl-meso-diaminopimelate ligase